MQLLPKVKTLFGEAKKIAAIYDQKEIVFATRTPPALRLSVSGCLMPQPQEITQLLIEWGNGNQQALDQLMPLVYAELHRMARRYMASQGLPHTLQTTGLIHEAYIRLAGDPGKQWENRAHFYRVAAKAMRHVLVDHARSQTAAKRGGEKRQLALDEALIISGERMASLVALDDALTDLSKLNARQCEVVELKYFGGLTAEETAEALKISPETVMRDWRAAKAWLHVQLSGRWRSVSNPMTPERYRQVVELCHAAWEQSADTRPAFLRRVCAAAPELQREIEAMLAADAAPGQFLDEPPDDIAAEALAARTSGSLMGKMLGDYQVLGRLGTGGMGDVYLAQDTRLRRKAALKLLPEPHTSHAGLLHRLEQEALAVSALNHPNIVTVYGLGRTGPLTFLATEFVEGRTLREELDNASLSPRIVVEIAIQVTRALQAAHSAGVIHRDIKPENIVLRPDGLVKVLDFGLAKWAERRPGVDAFAELSECKAAEGLIVGTPRYMSPEQASGVPVDARTDLFSLGAVFYEMLSGRPAVAGETPSDILADVLTRDPAPLESLRPECPAPLVRIVNRALKKDRDQRYQSAEEMAADLKALQRELESGVLVPAGTQPMGRSDENAAPKASAARRIPTPFSIWMAAGLAGILAGIYAVRRVPGDESRPLTITPLTTYPGREVQPSFSPDGNRVAFAFDGAGPSNYDIYVNAVGSEESTRLTSGPADDLSPSWSPDGQRITFLRSVSDHRALVMVVPSAGGAERQLAMLHLGRVTNEVRLAWSPDGEWIAASDEETSLSPMRLILISSRTGRKRRLAYGPPNAVADLSPSFSPDGRYLTYARHMSPAISDIYVLEVPKEGGPATEARALTHWNRLNRSPVWSTDGKEVFFVGDEARAATGIWRAPAFASGTARRISHIGEGSTSIAVSAKAKRLVYSKEIEDWNIWQIHLERASGVRQRGKALPSPLIASTYDDGQPQYSPDGKHVVFQSNRSGDFEIWIANSDGSSTRQLTRLHSKVSGYPRWSPDGKYIVFHSRRNGYANLNIVNVQTGSCRALTVGPTNDSGPSWSHDGKWIYFTSERSGSSQIWRIRAEGGPASQVTKNGGATAFDSIDSKLLYYSKYNEPGLWMLPLDGGYESQVVASMYEKDTFAVTKAGIYFACRTRNNEASINFMSLSPRFTKEIARIKSPIRANLAISPDGSALLYEQADQLGSDLVLVDNFE